MPEENEDEVALAMAFALAERFKEPKAEKVGTKNTWHRSVDSQMPLSWKRASGWRNVSRHESAKGRRSP